MLSAILPFVWNVSQAWDGADGNWSTFNIEVGTPPQSFRVLPAIASNELLIPTSNQCAAMASSINMSIAECGHLRGADESAGVGGFSMSNSSSWSDIGPYSLLTASSVYSNDAADFGHDAVVIENDNTNEILTNQVVGGVAALDFWLGVVGLGSNPANFLTTNNQSLLSSMKAQNMTPSLTYGYTAGAYYESSFGSLTIGGYDAARYKPTDQYIPISGGNQPSLEVTIGSISMIGSESPAKSFTSEGSPINMSIDSAVSQIWLPEYTCEQIAQAYGATFDNRTQYYTLNDSMHTKLQQDNPVLSFGLVANNKNYTTTIELHYSALDLSLSLPYYPNQTYYLPIRRTAANSTQYVLGRTFLQEAYVVVDWERRVFQIGPVTHVTNVTERNIISIESPTFAPNNGTSERVKPRIPIGLPIGIAFGSFAASLAAFAVIMWKYKPARKYFFERCYPARKPAGNQEEGLLTEKSPRGSDSRLSDMHKDARDSEIHEAPGEDDRKELASVEVREVPGDLGKWKTKPIETICELEGANEFPELPTPATPNPEHGQVVFLGEPSQEVEARERQGRVSISRLISEAEVRDSLISPMSEPDCYNMH